MPTDEITIEDLVNWYCEEHNIILWKDIPGYEGLYQVSNVGGMVRNKKTGIILKPSTTYDYKHISLCKNGTIKTHRIHKLVAKAWVPNPLGYTEVNHIDEVKTSNNAANLEWCDRYYNMNWGTNLKRMAVKLSKQVEQYTFEGTLVAVYCGAMEASRQTGYSQGTISSCCRGERTTAYGYIWKYKEG